MAHEIAELKLRKYCVELMGTRTFNARIKKFKDNPQMKLYALGAYRSYLFLYPIDTVNMTIVQPGLDNSISEHSLRLEELLKWGESIKPLAKLAFN